MRVEDAFPAIVTKTQFRKVNRQLRSRAPRKAHPRRVGSSYLLNAAPGSSSRAGAKISSNAPG